MKILELTDDEMIEIMANHLYLGDESYSIHTAILIYAKLKEQYPEEWQRYATWESTTDKEQSGK